MKNVRIRKPNRLCAKRGLLGSDDTIRAKVVDNVWADTLQSFISRKGVSDSIVCSDTMKI